ncbi:MAG: hypothetical protein P8X90_17295, partial [Desulfobacterales bacterium]
MQKIICSTEEAEPPGTKLAAFSQMDAESTQHREHNYLPNKKIPGMKSLPRVPVNLLLPENPRTLNFRKQFFPEAAASQWHNWRWQLRNRITTADGLQRIIRLSDDECRALVSNGQALPFAITPYYASLLDADDPRQALRRTVVPVTSEYLHSPGESHDPLGEDSDSPVPGLIHRYPD